MRPFDLNQHDMPLTAMYLDMITAAYYKPGKPKPGTFQAHITERDFTTLMNSLMALHAVAFDAPNQTDLVVGLQHLMNRPSVRVLDDPASPWSITLTLARVALKARLDAWAEKHPHTDDECRCTQDMKILADIERTLNSIP